MSTLQIKNLPNDLHDELKRQAARNGETMSAVVTRMIRRELEHRSMSDWVAELRRDHRPLRDIDTLAALDAVRDEVEEE